MRHRAGHGSDVRAGHGWVGDLLKQLRSAAPALSLLFRLSLVQLERLHREASHALSLQGLQLTPHSGRHGGPSEDAAAGIRTASEILKRGRWESPKSVNRYMKPGTLLRQLNLLPAAVVSEQSSVLTHLPFLLAPQPAAGFRGQLQVGRSRKRRRLL